MPVTLSIRAALLACALLLPASVMSEPVKDPVNLNLRAFGAEGVVRVNGVPVHYFKQAGPKVTMRGNTKVTDESPWQYGGTGFLRVCVNGENKISVEAKITVPEGYVYVKLSTFDGPNLFEQTLTKDGTISYTLAQSGLPEWAWVKADAVGDGKSELLKAVAAYHQAVAKKDIATIKAFEKPLYDDLKKAMPPEAFKQMMAEPENPASKLLPLPAVNEQNVEGLLGGTALRSHG